MYVHFVISQKFISFARTNNLKMNPSQKVVFGHVARWPKPCDGC